MNARFWTSTGIVACAVLLAGLAPGRMAAAPDEEKPEPAQETCPLHAAAATAPKPDLFASQVRPILEARCQPCHFEGGKMYASMPFDRPETIRMLGEKMFSRIKDEREAAALRAFLAEPVPAH